MDARIFRISRSPALALIFTAVFTLNSCTYKTQETPLEFALGAERDAIKTVARNPEAYEVQLMYSRIRRQGDTVVFTDYAYREDPSRYFYPASTVKFPVALLALEKISQNDSIFSASRFFTEGDTSETTLGDEVRKIFAVSDNAAYNRLYEFLGRDTINHRLREMNIGPVRIAHRLSVDDADDPNTRPLIFYLNDTTLCQWPKTINQPVSPLNIDLLQKGKGYYQDGILVEEPMDFSQKNYLPIRSLHNLMKRVIFPENFRKQERFNLKEKDRELILESMSSPPYQQGYDRKEYYDSYVKFFLYGDRKTPIPRHIKIYNKVGYAYGYLTDCAYIRDSRNNIEFILTATLHVNRNGIFNDDNYEYDEVGIPFLAELGRQLYAYELRERD